MEPPTKEQGARIGAFLAKGGDTEDPARSRERLPYWKLARNPFLQGIAYAFVSSSANGEQLVSTFTVTPKLMWAWGREVNWAEVGDTVTLSEFQRRGLFSDLHNSITASALEAGIETMYGLPNQNSLPGYVKKFKWRVKENANLITYTKVNGTRRVADMAASRLSGSIFGRIIGGILRSPFLNKPVKSVTKAWTQLQPKGGAEIEIVSDFSDDFTELWIKARPNVSVCTLRDRRYLTWRFVENPLPFKIFCARREGDVVGYLVTLFERDKRAEHGRLSIADWLYDPAAGKQVGSDLLRRALLEPQDGEVDVVSAWTVNDSPFPLPWERFGFIRRKASKPLIFFPNENGMRASDDVSKWHFTLGDTDPF